jgi:hypothetical protein
MSVFDAVQFAQALDAANWNVAISARRDGIPWNRLVNAQGFQALHLAILHGQPLVVDHLLSWGAPVGPYVTADGTRHAPLWAAIDRDMDGVAARLIDAGADIESVYQSPLKDAAEPPVLVAASQRWLPLTMQAALARGAGLRTLTADQRVTVFQAWFEALSDPKTGPGAEAVLTDLTASGWFPGNANEAEQLEGPLQTALHQSPDPREVLQKLQAQWRQRQGHPQGPRSATVKRARS